MRHLTINNVHDMLKKKELEVPLGLRTKIRALVFRIGTYTVDEKLKWRKQPVLDIIDDCICEIEVALWDSGEITAKEQKKTEQFYTAMFRVKAQVRLLLADGTQNS